MKKITEEVIRVRFLREDDGKAPSRPKRIRKVTYEKVEKKGKTNEYIKYYSMQAPTTRKGLVILFNDIDPTTFITKWEKGPTPTARPVRRYNDEKLKEMGYSALAINEIRGRKYRAKDVSVLYSRLKGAVDNRKIRKILEDCDGSTIAAMEMAKEYIRITPKTKKEVRRAKKTARDLAIKKEYDALKSNFEKDKGELVVGADTDLKNAA